MIEQLIGLFSSKSTPSRKVRSKQRENGFAADWLTTATRNCHDDERTAFDVGRENNRNPAFAQAWQDGKKHEVELDRAKVAFCYRSYRASCEERLKTCRDERALQQTERERHSSKSYTWAGVVGGSIFGGGTLIADGFLNASGFALTGIRSEWVRFLVSLVAVLILAALYAHARNTLSSALPKLLRRKAEQVVPAPEVGAVDSVLSIFGGLVAGSTAGILLYSLAKCRYEYARLIDVTHPLLGKAVEACGPALLWLTFALSAGLTIVLANVVESVLEAIAVLKLERQMRRLDREIGSLERDIAIAEVEHRELNNVLDRLDPVQQSEFLQGGAKGQVVLEERPSVLSSIWSKILGLLATLALVVSLSGCTQGPAIFVAPDGSGSVGMIDHERRAALRLIGSYAPKGSELSVMPVGAEAQRPVIVEFPANDDTGLGDVYEERVKELDLGVARLLTHLDRAASDYLSPWRFASERCAARECVVIFLGDMLHSPRIRGKRSSSVPSLTGLSFPNAKIYLGFVRTQNGEPPSPEFQNRWVEEIRKVSGPKTTITVSSFGLDSLERFLRENVGPKRVPLNLPVRSVVQ